MGDAMPRIEMGPELGPERHLDPVEDFVESIAIRGTYEVVSADEVKAELADALETGLLTEDQAYWAGVNLGIIDN
jgi:hypothetical protein